MQNSQSVSSSDFQQKSSSPGKNDSPPESIPFNQYMLLKDNDNKRNECYLCRLLKSEEWKTTKARNPSKATSTSCACLQHKKTFCANCFSAYHNFKKLKQERPDYVTKIENKESYKCTNGKLRNRTITNNTTFQNIKFSFDKYF